MLFFSAKEYAIYFTYNILTGEAFGNPFYSKWAEWFVNELGPQDGDKLEALANELRVTFPTAKILFTTSYTSNAKPDKNIVY
jgi:hypothetical protein